jgi:hypothetical protein
MNYAICNQICITFLEDISSTFTLCKLIETIKTDTMNNKIIGYWNEKKEKLKQKYKIIKDEDLGFCDGKEKEMMEMLGYKLGKTIDELRSIIVEL